MYATSLRCLNCKTIMNLDYLYECPDCKGALDVVYDYKNMLDNLDTLSLFETLPKETSHYCALLPIENPDQMITLGEGGTPLLPLTRLRDGENQRRIYLKTEGSNPSGSFKDRPLAVSVSRAREIGLNTVIIASSGNAGTAAAAYSARANLRCIVLVPAGTPTAKVSQALAYGAKVIKVDGTYSDCFRLALSSARENGFANVSTTYLNPYNLEGDKTIAYEMFTQLEGNVPDWIVVPIGAGPLLSGVYKGYRELLRLGITEKLPAMVGVQASGCAPIAQAYEQGTKRVHEWKEEVQTLASGIADPLRGYARDGKYTLATILESGGKAIAVTDEEILAAIYDLGRFEGVFVEPSGATAFAALEKLTEEGTFKSEDSIVLLLTGHGLKDPHSLQTIFQEPPQIGSNIKQLASLLG